jgi:DNA-binding transcriptional LysR family regulator
LDGLGQEFTVNVKGGGEINNSLAVRECLLKGLGLALIPGFVVQEDIKAGQIELLLPGYRDFARGLYAVIPNRKRLSPKARALIDFLKSSNTLA